MSILQTLPFTDSINYNFSNTEIVGGKAKLSVIPNPGQVFTQDFSSAAGFTYDNTKAEFIGGVVRQKSQIKNCTFSNVVGVSVVGNTLAKTTPTGAWNAGARSVEQIASGDGYIQFVADQVGNAMGGMSNTDVDQNFGDLEYGFALGVGNAAAIYESGVVKGTVSYNSGDVFRVEILSGVVYFKINGAVVYTSAVAPIYTLFFDSSFYDNGASLSSIQILN